MSTPALELRGLGKSFGATRVLDGVCLSVAAGERCALIGPNGAGKTTLFNLVSGLLRPDHGAILLAGHDIAGRAPWTVQRRGVARSFQVTSLFGGLSVRDNLRLASLRALGHGAAWWCALANRRDVTHWADEVLEMIGLTARATVAAGLLTYAEQRALELGMAIAGRPRVLLLDEPTAGMSRAETDAAIALIRRVSVGQTVVLIEHDMDAVFQLADRIAVLDQGRLIASGTPAAVAADARVQAAYLGQAPC